MKRAAFALCLALLWLIVDAWAQPTPPGQPGVPTDPGKTFTATITKSGVGVGTVTGPGINCGVDCSEPYIVDTTVSFTATPTAGSTFTGWSGACSGTGVCTVKMSQARTITATFAQPLPTLSLSVAGTGTVTSAPTGISCPTDCTESYAPNTSVTLTATPSATFQGWSGTGVGGGGGGGTQRQAIDCNRQNVQNAVTLSVNGDTVIIPAGTCIWTSPVTVNVGITIQGAGQSQTFITDQRDRSVDGNGGLLIVNIPSGQFFRLTGTTWQSPAFLDTMAFDGTIQLSGCSPTSPSYRIDHNTFNQLANGQNIIATGSLFGLVDNNNGIADSRGTTHLLTTGNRSWARDGVTCTGQWGDGSWAGTLAPGSNKAHYVEHNVWNFPPGVAVSAAIVDADFGARTVVRYNQLLGTSVGSHGTDTAQRFRGQRWLEVYENDFIYPAGTPVDFAMWFRGGSGVVFNNRVTVDTTAGFNSVVKHSNLRSSDFSRTYPPWGFCDGSSVYDGNAGPPAGYRCLDQPGAGTSIDYNDANTPPSTPAGNALEPIYVWQNTVNGAADNCGSLGCQDDGVVVAGRDIIFGTARPSFTPYTYPHPLQNSTGSNCPGTTPCTVVMDQSRNVTATFTTVSTAPLTVSVTGTGQVTGTGISCGTGSANDCAESYTLNQNVVLTEVPVSGTSFLSWSGCTSTSGNTCTVAMSQARSVTANFTALLNLAWDHDGQNLNNFSLERRTPCATGTYGVLATPASGARAYTDPTAVPGTHYQYRVQAVGPGGISAYSNEVCSP